MSNVEKAVECFKQGYSCSCAIFSNYGTELGIDKANALKVSAPFGAGMARMGETCGCVTGALMVLGLKYAAGKDSKEKLYRIANEFADKFKKKNGSVMCRELLGYDISTDEGFNIIKEKNLVNTLCPKLVQSAAEILEEIMGLEQ
jgi:C_GCAxxG_C_C family probable redox protein